MLKDVERELAHGRLIELVNAKCYVAAIDYCRDNIGNWDPVDRHHAWGDLAYAMSQSGRKSEALSAASHAIELAPEHRGHRLQRAMLATESGRYELASEDWSKLIQIERDKNSEAFLATALLGRAFVRIQTHKFAEALHDLQLVDNDEEIFVCGELRAAADLRKLLSEGSTEK